MIPSQYLGIRTQKKHHGRTLLAVCASQFAAWLLHFTPLSVVVCLCSTVAGFTAALGWFFCP